MVFLGDHPTKYYIATICCVITLLLLQMVVDAPWCRTTNRRSEVSRDQDVLSTSIVSLH